MGLVERWNKSKPACRIDTSSIVFVKETEYMKNKGKLIFFAMTLALLFAAVISGCGGGGGSSTTTGSGTLSGSAK